MATYARGEIAICKKETKLDYVWLRLTEIIFPERFPHHFKYSWGISYEYFPGWPEQTEEEIIRLCLRHTIFKNFCMYHKLKERLNSRNSHQRCSIRKAVLKIFAIFTGKHQSPFNRLAGFKTCNFYLWILQNF